MKNLLRPRSLSIGLTALVALTAFSLGAPPATADHGGCIGTNHRIFHHNSWTVTDLHRDFYRAGQVGLAGIALVDPGNGDADLYVWSLDCTVTTCSSTKGAGQIDSCPVLSGQVIEVRYFSGGTSCPAGWNGNFCLPYTVHEHLV